VSLNAPDLPTDATSAMVRLDASIARATDSVPEVGRRVGATLPVILPSATGAAPACEAHVTTMQAAARVNLQVLTPPVWSTRETAETRKSLMFARRGRYVPDRDVHLHIGRRNCDAAVERSSALEALDEALGLVL
jgi:hypothetical protein